MHRAAPVQPALQRAKDCSLFGSPPEDIAAAQETIRWADHLVIVFPLWLGAMPALLKAFLEQVMRPGFALPRRACAAPGPGSCGAARPA